MINAMRTLIHKNPAGRLMFATGVAGLILSGVCAVLHLEPALARAMFATVSVAQQQQGLLIVSMLLFAMAWLRVRGERERKPGFIDFVLEFWQFRPLQGQRPLSYRLLEWAHLSFIVLMFHRALFL